jgi:hypothetical protein
MQLTKIKYVELNAKQKESYNFQGISAVLATYGFNTIRLSDDWQGADFIAQHIDGEQFLKIQLKGRLTIDKKYIGKNIYICFRENKQWYLYSHDEFLAWLKSNTTFETSDTWQTHGSYHWSYLNKTLSQHLRQFALSGDDR